MSGALPQDDQADRADQYAHADVLGVMEFGVRGPSGVAQVQVGDIGSDQVGEESVEEGGADEDAWEGPVGGHGCLFRQEATKRNPIPF
ncbi:hypothetical protein ACQP0C_36625 [Nocardia sp. CA-129566]|uniref:hypothetical protein n=1 Tax=Nocardia sp. CA-129566 TaxID=3239976 RepID=UPI003D997187